MDVEQRLAAFEEWRARPGRVTDRIGELDQIAADDPEGWRDAMLYLLPSRPTVDWLEQNNLFWLGLGIRAALRTSRDSATMQADLVKRARRDPVVAAVLASALAPLGSNEKATLDAIEILGEDLLFETWSRAHWNVRENKAEADVAELPEVEVDQWADEFMTVLTFRNPDAAWDLFLRYLGYELDAGLQAQAGIAWLESINFRGAEAFIERIEVEAKKNDRLRAVMQRMYPPPGDASIKVRFADAAREPRG